MIYTNENWKPPVTYCEPNEVEVQKMNKQEAIELLVNATYSDEWQGNERLTEANLMAIDALQKDTERHEAAIRASERNLGIVRCKDCDRGYGSPVCPIQSEGWVINQDTFYCAWGERREP